MPGSFENNSKVPPTVLGRVVSVGCSWRLPLKSSVVHLDVCSRLPSPSPLITEQLCSPAILQHLDRSYQLSGKGKCPGPFYSWELATRNILGTCRGPSVLSPLFSLLPVFLPCSPDHLWNVKTPRADHPPNQTNQCTIRANSVPRVVPGQVMVLKSSHLDWLKSTILRTQALVFCRCLRPSLANASFPFSK